MLQPSHPTYRYITCFPRYFIRNVDHAAQDSKHNYVDSKLYFQGKALVYNATLITALPRTRLTPAAATLGVAVVIV